MRFSGDALNEARHVLTLGLKGMYAVQTWRKRMVYLGWVFTPNKKGVCKLIIKGKPNDPHVEIENYDITHTKDPNERISF